MIETGKRFAHSESSSKSTKKSSRAFLTISEVSKKLEIPQHVLRFWETKFNSIKPMKRGGGRRYYRPKDVEFIKQIRSLLYFDGYTIKGVQKLLRNSDSKLTLEMSTVVQTQLFKPAKPKDFMIGKLRIILTELKQIRAELKNNIN